MNNCFMFIKNCLGESVLEFISQLKQSLAVKPLRTPHLEHHFIRETGIRIHTGGIRSAQVVVRLL